LIPIPEWKWEDISMDIITAFPKTYRQHDFIMVVVDRSTKVAHFIPMKSTNSSSEVSQTFIKDLVRPHGVREKIILDIDSMFTTRFCKDIFLGFGKNLAFSKNYGPYTSG